MFGELWIGAAGCCFVATGSSTPKMLFE